jgi:hypothetical protein
VVSRILKAVHVQAGETDLKADDHYRCASCLRGGK